MTVVERLHQRSDERVRLGQDALTGIGQRPPPSEVKPYSQAKHWRSRVVRLPQVRELWGAVADEHANGAIFVTSGSFTDDARRWTAAKNLTLIDGAQLVGLIASVQVSASSSPTLATPTPLCRVCGRPMVLRTARHGRSAGQTFWGCSGYPQCRNTEAATSP